MGNYSLRLYSTKQICITIKSRLKTHQTLKELSLKLTFYLYICDQVLIFDKIPRKASGELTSSAEVG